MKALGETPAPVDNPLDVMGNLVDALILGLAMIGIMLAFAILALQIIVSLLEFKIVTLGGFVLLPFGIWNKTAFLAERPLGYVVSSGLKVLALAIVVSGARTIFDQLQPSSNPDVYEALTILVASLLLAMLAIFIPNLASALVTGGPALGAGTALTGGLAVAGAGALVAGGAAGAGAMVGRAASVSGSARSASGAAASARPPNGGGPSWGGGSSGPKPPPSSPSGFGASVGGRSPSLAPAASASSPLAEPSTSSAPPSAGETPSAKPGSAGPPSPASSGPGAGRPWPPLPQDAPASTARSPSGRSAALQAFFVANSGRGLMPAGETSGALSPRIRPEES